MKSINQFTNLIVVLPKYFKLVHFSFLKLYLFLSNKLVVNCFLLFNDVNQLALTHLENHMVLLKIQFLKKVKVLQIYRASMSTAFCVAFVFLC